MAKYSGGSGGGFIKFEKVGTTCAGKLTGVRLGNEYNGKREHVADFRAVDGTSFSVDLGKVVLKDLWFNQAKPQVGERVVITYTGERETKRGKPAKMFDLELPDRPDEDEAVIITRAGEIVRPEPAPASGDLAAAVAALVAAKGQAAADAIVNAAKAISNGDETKMVAVIRGATGVAA